jgi:aldehyde dehydrogenase (NAD+)
MAPLLAAIAGGNCSIIKPSELSPHTSSLLAELINPNFEAGYLHVKEGDAQTTQSLLSKPLDYIFFTGSSRVGKIIMKAAAEQLTPVTLELGGKSPTIVDQTADLSLAAKRIAWGKFINAGQTCVSPDYVYIHKSIRDKFCALLVNTIQEFYGDDPSKSSDFSRIINEKHYQRLINLLDQDKVYVGGQYDPEDNYISPTVMTDITWQHDIMKEEIFGPILPILTYNSLDEVISNIRSRPKPLALYLFSNDRSTQQQIINNLTFGGGCINDTVVHLGNLELPFGGVGQSGFGSYHGKKGFDTFTHQKSVMKKSNWLDIPLRYPPYKEKFKWLKRLSKYL